MDFYQYQIQEESMAILYMQFISDLILHQQGFVSNAQKAAPTESFVKAGRIPYELNLKDIKEKPLIALQQICNYFIH